MKIGVPSLSQLIQSSLFAEVSDTYIVGEPHRQFTSHAAVSVPGGGIANANLVISLAESLTVNDALYIERMILNLSVPTTQPAGSLNLLNATAQIADAVNNLPFYTWGQGLVPTNAWGTDGTNVGYLSVQFTAPFLVPYIELRQWNALVNTFDLNVEGQPLLWFASVGVANFNGSAIEFNSNLEAQYRVVHGVNES